MKNVWRRLTLIFHEADPQPIELMLGALALIWAGVFFRSDGLFSTSRAYAAMSDLASQDVWACVFLTLGVCQIAAVLGRVAWLKRAACFAMTLLWGFAAATFWLSTPNLLAAPQASLWTFVAAWTYGRVSRAYR